MEGPLIVANNGIVAALTARDTLSIIERSFHALAAHALGYVSRADSESFVFIMIKCWTCIIWQLIWRFDLLFQMTAKRRGNRYHQRCNHLALCLLKARVPPFLPYEMCTASPPKYESMTPEQQETCKEVTSQTCT